MIEILKATFYRFNNDKHSIYQDYLIIRLNDVKNKFAVLLNFRFFILSDILCGKGQLFKEDKNFHASSRLILI